MSKVNEWKEKYGFDKNTDAILVCVDEIDDLVLMVREECKIESEKFAIMPRNPSIKMLVPFMFAPSVLDKELTSKELFSAWLSDNEIKPAK